MTTESFWQPPDFNSPDSGIPGEIKILFSELYPSNQYEDLADEINQYWLSKLKEIWANKPERIKTKDLKYTPKDPLSRIEQKTVLISYADSVRENGKPTLNVLDSFLQYYFPAIRGLHILPPCEISEERFNDGGFSQIRRNRIHAAYGANAQFADMMENFYSMTDLVLNHVDIEHPNSGNIWQVTIKPAGVSICFPKLNTKNDSLGGISNRFFAPAPFRCLPFFEENPGGPLLINPTMQQYLR